MSRNCIYRFWVQVFAILSSRSLYAAFRQRYESNMLDTIVAFIVMQKSELMLDVEQFGSRLDTIDLDNRPGTKYANSADVGAGPTKTINANDCMCSYIDGFIKISMQTWARDRGTRERRSDQRGKRKCRAVWVEVLFSRCETVRPLHFLRIDR